MQIWLASERPVPRRCTAARWRPPPLTGAPAEVSRNVAGSWNQGCGKELCNFSDSLVVEALHSGFAQKRT